MGVGIVLWLFAWTFKDMVLTIGGGIFFMAGLLSLMAFNTGVDYTATQYRLYKRLFFIKSGQWRSIADVHYLFIRPYSYIHNYSYTRDRFTKLPGKERVELYQLYFVRKGGYDKLFESEDLRETETFAECMANKYGMKVERKSPAHPA